MSHLIKIYAVTLFANSAIFGSGTYRVEILNYQRKKLLLKTSDFFHT